MEKSLDDDLKNSQIPIKLTVDNDVQFLIRQELLRFNEIFKTKGSAAILMDVNTGEILSLVSLPDFDPNKREKILDKNSVHYDEIGKIIDKEMIIDQKTKLTIDELKSYNTNWLKSYMV